MDWPHLHVLFNHVPIIGVPIAFVLMVWGLNRGSRDLARAAAAGAVIFGVAGFGAAQAGERAADRLEGAKVTWLNKDAVEEHEERAETAEWVGLAAAALAVVLLWMSRGGRSVPVPVGWGVAGLLAIASVLFAWTALAGGAIRHDEFLRGGVAPPAVERATSER